LRNVPAMSSALYSPAPIAAHRPERYRNHPVVPAASLRCELPRAIGDESWWFRSDGQLETYSDLQRLKAQ
jgi:hypothetical protein